MDDLDYFKNHWACPYSNVILGAGLLCLDERL